MNSATLEGFRQLADSGDELTADQVRTAVIGYLYHNGVDHWRLSRDQWEGCYFLADGFGNIDRDFAESQCWDWSHIRDSSEAAFRRIWEAICHWHNRGRLKPQCDC